MVEFNEPAVAVGKLGRLGFLVECPSTSPSSNAINVLVENVSNEPIEFVGGFSEGSLLPGETLFWRQVGTTPGSGGVIEFNLRGSAFTPTELAQGLGAIYELNELLVMSVTAGYCQFGGTVNMFKGTGR